VAAREAGRAKTDVSHLLQKLHLLANTVRRKSLEMRHAEGEGSKCGDLERLYDKAAPSLTSWPDSAPVSADRVS